MIIITPALVWVSDSLSFLLLPLSLVASPLSGFMQARQSRAAEELPCSGAQEFLRYYSFVPKAALLALHPHPSRDRRRLLRGLVMTVWKLGGGQS